jgi:peptidoglycan hydrolase-like protein with peptidoglycan-binding domain
VRIEARTYQAALKDYGFDPGPLDGVLGPATTHAAQEFDMWVEFEEGGELWGDYSITPAADNRSVEILPDSAARRFQTRGTTYLTANPDEIVFPPSRSTPTRTASSSDVPLAPPAPLAFVRMGNPWLWLLVALGLLGLGGGAFLIARRMRGAR